MRLTMQSVSRTAALLAAVTATVASAAPDSAALIARLARRAPASIAFAEVRFSSLLVEPLVVHGTLEYEASGVLNRRVETPYRESTSIRDETVRVERDGESARTFALRRAPELRGFVTGMLGLLTGDSSLIDEHFSVVAAGDDERWRLDLEPVDDRLRATLEQHHRRGRRGRAALLRDRRHPRRHERDVARSRGGAAATAADRARRAARPLRGMKRSAAAFLVILAWAAGLAALGLLVERRLDVELRPAAVPAGAGDARAAPAARRDRRRSRFAPARRHDRRRARRGAGRDVERAGRAAARRRAVPLRRERRRRARLAARGPAAVSLLAVGRRRDSCARSRQPPLRAPSARTRPRIAGRLRRRAVDRARSDVADADTRGTLAAGERAAPRIRRLVRRGRRACAARRRDARAGVRSRRPTSRARRARRGVRGRGRPGRHDADGERRRQLLGAHGSADAQRGRKPGALGDGRHAVGSAGRVSAPRRPDLERLAARERSRRRPRSGQRAIRLRARHHARVRLHAARRRAGLSAASLEPPPPRRRARARRGRPVAHARHGHREHVRRVPDVLVQRRHGTAAARVFHRDRARGRRLDRALCAAARHDAGTARLRPVARARAARASHR